MSDNTLDYDALLTAARVQYTLMIETLAAIAADEYTLALHGTPFNDPAITDCTRRRTKATNTYLHWIQVNITDRSITLHSERYTGKPVGLSIVVAGRR